MRHDEPDRGDQEDCTEDIADPGEAIEQADAGSDECAAHENGSEDSPEEDAGLFEGLNLEDAEEKKEDEEVVDGERFFDSVSGKIFDGVVGTEGIEDKTCKGKGGGDPKDGGDDGGTVGFGGRRGRVAPASVEELKRKQDKEKDVEADPMTEWGGGRHV